MKILPIALGAACLLDASASASASTSGTREGRRRLGRGLRRLQLEEVANPQDTGRNGMGPDLSNDVLVRGGSGSSGGEGVPLPLPPAAEDDLNRNAANPGSWWGQSGGPVWQPAPLPPQHWNPVAPPPAPAPWGAPAPWNPPVPLGPQYVAPPWNAPIWASPPPGCTYFYPDNDNDGYGDKNAAPMSICSRAGGDGDDDQVLPDATAVSNNGDCNDNDRYVFPGAVEICEDNKINDCGSINNDRNYHVCKCRIGQATYDPPIWYRDADGDGQGSATVYVRGCAKPSGYVENNTDCDDSSSSAGVTPCYVEIASTCTLSDTSMSTGTDCSTLSTNSGKLDCPAANVGVTSITFRFTAASCASSANAQAATVSCIDNIALPDTTSARHIDITQVGGTGAGSKGSGVVAVGGTIAATGIATDATSISVTISGSSAGAGTVYQTITVISLSCAAVTDLKTCDNFGAVEVVSMTNASGSVTRPTVTATVTTTRSYPTTAPTGTPSTYQAATSTNTFFTTVTQSGGVNAQTTGKSVGTTATSTTDVITIDSCDTSVSYTVTGFVTAQRSTGSHCVDTSTATLTYSQAA